jgi:hypothetical protein
VVAIFAALISAAFFAASSAVQQQAAGSESANDRSGAKLFVQLARIPRWWLGLAMSAVAFALHAVALAHGMLSIVQPIIVSGLVFAVFARAGLERRLPPRAIIGWCALTWAGLAAFIAVLHSSPAKPPHPGPVAWFVSIAVVVVVVVVVAARRAQVDERRGLLFGVAAGVLYGLVAGLVKVVLAQSTPQLWTAVEHGSFWVLVVVGVGAVALNQRAFQATRLSVTMPVVNIVNVLVAIAFGVAVFDEQIFSSPLSLVIEVVGLAAMAVGVRQLASRDNRPEDEPASPQTGRHTGSSATRHPAADEESVGRGTRP